MKDRWIVEKKNEGIKKPIWKKKGYKKKDKEEKPFKMSKRNGVKENIENQERKRSAKYRIKKKTKRRTIKRKP